MEHPQVCPTDGSFGPAIGSCRGGFDFTLAFEDSILGLVPQAAFLLLCPFRLATLRRRRRKVAKNSHLGFLKTVTSSCYAISSVVLLVIWSELETYKTKLSIASASLEFLAALAIVTLSRHEHERAVRPSHLLQFFLLVLLLCDAVRLRTLFLMQYPAGLVTPASIHAFLTGLLLLLESLDKRELLYSDQDRSLPPEELVGLFGKRLFWYLNDLFREGYRKILKPSDLSNIDADLASQERDIQFQQVWARQDKSKSAPLIRVIFKVLWRDLLAPVAPRLLQMATTLSQPYLISAMISFIQRQGNTHHDNVGYGLVAAFALNYSLLAISSSWSAQASNRFSTKLRSCLISAIYEKTLNISSTDVNLGSATVLMNVDVEKVLIISRYLHEFWATFISVGIALYVLYTHLGIAFLSPFFTTLVATGICTLLGKYLRPRYAAWAAATETRVTTIAYVASCMKGVRMLGLTETVLVMLTKLREFEFEAYQKARSLLVWVLLISNVMFQITTVATYVTYTVIALLKKNEAAFDYNILYGSLSALKLVTSPLVTVLQFIPSLQNAMASLDRIRVFLESGSVAAEGVASSGQEIGEDDIELSPMNVSSREWRSAYSATRAQSLGMSSAQTQSETTPRRLNAMIASMENATFGIDGKPLLHQINCTFLSGFTMVIGTVGSGKSLLCKTLVCETRCFHGSFRPPSSGTALCDQSVWLRNVSIRENILGESDFDENWYNTVVWSCGLLRDFTEMKKGDRTSVGSKGISLSGGQKNRISLARTLYARRPVSVIDDMLAGLDNTTEKLVFDRVFGPKGLFRTSEATVILATHATHYARFADRIIILQEGRIIEDGTYQELIAKGVDLRDHGGASNDDSDEPSEQGTDIYQANKRAAPVNTEENIQEEQNDATRQSGDRGSLLFYLRSVGKFHAWIYLALLLTSQAATTIQFLWLKWWAQAGEADTMRNLYLFIVITVINIVLYLLWEAHFVMVFIPRSGLSLHARQLTALMRAKFSLLVSIDIGSITNRFSQDIVLVDNELQGAFLNFTSELVVIISNLVITIVASPPIAGAIPLLAAVGYCIQQVYLRTSRQIRLMDLEAKAPLCTHFLESLAGIVTIRAFGWSTAYREKNRRYLNQSQVPFYLLTAIQNWLSLVLELVVAGLITALVGLAVGLRSKVDPGYLGLALVSAMDLGFSFRMLIFSWTTLETSLGAITRIRSFSETPSESQGLSTSDPPESWPVNGSIQFAGVAASYSEDGKTILSDISLTIRPGEKIGLCGRTGSGKSSLVATLFGLLHQQAGDILIDGVSTNRVSLSALRSNIIALPQDPFFLRGTVRHNLAPWSSEEQRAIVSDEQMQDALQQVQLWDKLSAAAGVGEAALDVSLNNVDSLLSQGEKQLFCLARAILMDGKIVVLDEATSSVDAKTDALMQQILRSAFADRTIIAIAHRLHTILDFDRIVVMEKGSIAEVGEPEELMAADCSLFKILMESQGKT